MPIPWLRAEPFFFGVGNVADQVLLGISLPNFRGDEASNPPLRFSGPHHGLDDATYLRSRLVDRRR